MPLSEKTIQVVEKTAPAVAAAGSSLIAAFYNRMLSGNPELKDIFNLAHQSNMRQPTALFESVVAYATHLRELQALGPAVERIAQKHASFQITPAQYQIVGHHLLKTIEEKLNPGDEVIAEWGKAYEQLADILIAREKEVYETAAAAAGGWRGERAFKVAEKTKQSDIITSFKLVPQDGKPVMLHKPGQYLGLYVRHPSLPLQEIRQYSIVSAPNAEYYEIAVRRHDKGQVSRFLHDTVAAGDQLQIVPPFGDFFLAEPASESAAVVLASAGVGLTPALCMLRHFSAAKTKRPLYWLQGARTSATRAYAAEVAALQKQLPGLKVVHWLSQPAAGDKEGVDYDFKGHVDVTKGVPAEVLTKPDTQIYFEGPDGFMDAVKGQLDAAKVPESNYHFECFGPFRAPQPKA